MQNSKLVSVNEEILIQNSSVSLFIKREDLLHPFVSGNKFRKLKYNLIEAKKQNYTAIITFGGAFSNHIAATAYACKENGFDSVGIIRGNELESKIEENPTLKFAQNCGMKFEFVSREVYREKNSDKFLSNLKNKYDNHFLIPEGGTNELAVLGCEEILEETDKTFNFVCCCVGTGGTISGIINSSNKNQKIIGFSALKGKFLKNEIRKFAKNKNWELNSDFNFGGYAKVTPELIEFMNDFYKKNQIKLDPVYTSKMVFGVLDLIDKNFFPKNSKILMIHSGGLQGIAGMNLKLENKKLQKINFDV